MTNLFLNPLTVVLYSVLPWLLHRYTAANGDDVNRLGEYLKQGAPLKYLGQLPLYWISPAVYYYGTPVVIFAALWTAFGSTIGLLAWGSLILISPTFNNQMFHGSSIPLLNLFALGTLSFWLASKGNRLHLSVVLLLSILFHPSTGIIVVLGTALGCLIRRDIHTPIAAVPALIVGLILYENLPYYERHVSSNLMLSLPDFRYILQYHIGAPLAVLVAITMLVTVAVKRLDIRPEAYFLVGAAIVSSGLILLNLSVDRSANALFGYMAILCTLILSAAEKKLTPWAKQKVLVVVGLSILLGIAAVTPAWLQMGQHTFIDSCTREVVPDWCQ